MVDELWVIDQCGYVMLYRDGEPWFNRKIPIADLFEDYVNYSEIDEDRALITDLYLQYLIWTINRLSGVKGGLNDG